MVRFTTVVLSPGHQALLNLETFLEVQLPALLRHMLTACDTQHPHLGIVPQPGQEFGRDEEILRSMLPTGDLDHAFVHHAFVARVHSLINLINDAEGGLGQALQGHEVEDGRDGAFAARLAVGIELLELFGFTS